MKETDIRPDDLARELYKLSQEDYHKVLLRKSEFIEVSCPACESSNYQLAFTKSESNFVVCSECETIFVNPRPAPQLLAEHYATGKSFKFWNDKMFPASENSRRAQIFAPRARKIAELCKIHGSETDLLLDVGAGFGTFCEEIEKVGVFNEVMAVEPAYDLAETCRRKGINVIEKTIEEAYLSKASNLSRVSVVTSFELIEHLFCPKDFIDSCARVLSPGGLFILTTPNIKSFEVFVLGKLSAIFGGVNHLNYFHPSSLAHLLRRYNFEVLEVLTPGKLDVELVRKKALNSACDVLAHPFFKHILIEGWETTGGAFQRFLADNMLSSHLWIVAKKK